MIRVLIVNEVPLVSDLIAALLQGEADIEVIGSVQVAEQAASLLSQCDVALISAGLARGEAGKLTHWIAEEFPAVRMLVVGLGKPGEEALACLAPGVCGHVLPNDTTSTLLETIRNAYVGKRDAPENIRSKDPRHLDNGNDSAELTPREFEILKLIDQGLTNQEIANQLFVEVGTVKHHVHNILQKLDVSNRQDAAEYWSILGKAKAGKVEGSKEH
ncbi:MAG: response regulator transcription factor [Chloroflexi bacterium]|nr:response regulator transcription factor [Chloroflexota bacterium]